MNRATQVGRTIAAVCLLAAAACSSSDGDTTSESAPKDAPNTAGEEASAEPTTTEPLETTPTTAAPATAPPVTAEPETVEPPATEATNDSTIQPSDTVLVPFHIVDASFPAGWTCDDAIPGFDVAFTDVSGERTIVEARFTTSFRTSTEDPNAACAIELFGGTPALFVTAQLEAPAAEIYQLIETRFPFANGAGNDRYDTIFETVTSEEAQAGLYVAVQPNVGPVPVDPSEAVGFPPVE